MGLQRIGPGLTLVALAALSAVLSACGGENQAATQTGSADGTFTKGGDDRTGPYSVVEGWWKSAPDHGDEWSWGSVSGVAADTPNRIIVAIWGEGTLEGPDARVSAGTRALRRGV